MPSSAGPWLREDTIRNARFMDVPFRGTPAGFGISLNSMRCQRVLTAIAESKASPSSSSWFWFTVRCGVRKLQEV